VPDAVGVELVGELRVGRRIDVDLGALTDLGRQLVGAGERHLDVGVLRLAELRSARLQRLRHRRGRGYHQPRGRARIAAAVVIVAAAAGREREAHCQRRGDATMPLGLPCHCLSIA